MINTNRRKLHLKLLCASLCVLCPYVVHHYVS